MEYDDELDAAAFEPPPDLHHFAKARMITVGDPGLSRLFVGSMSPFRTAAARPAGAEVMNSAPGRIAALTRDSVAEMFADETSIVAPATVRADRVSLHQVAHGQIGLSALLPNKSFPIIVRPYGSHAGEGLEKIAGLAEVGAYLERRSEQHFYLAPFI